MLFFNACGKRRSSFGNGWLTMPVKKKRKERILDNLREEEERLRSSIIGLRGEQEGLTRQKLRLAGDVSSLETALRIRREELDEMEGRAAALERRILEGVMDHSRAFSSWPRQQKPMAPMP